MPKSSSSSNSTFTPSANNTPAAPTISSITSTATVGTVNVLVSVPTTATAGGALTPAVTSIFVFSSIQPLPTDIDSLFASDPRVVNQTQFVVSGSPATVTVPVSGLVPGVLYNFEAVASND